MDTDAKEYVAILAVIAALSAMLVWALYANAAKPTVYMSFERSSCVRVHDVTDSHTCDNLPAKYNHVWVK